MSCYRLRTYDQSPPGGYCFEETVNGRHKRYPCEPMIEAQARNVAGWRAANGWPRGNVKEALTDVDHFNCARLGGNPAYCVKCDKAQTGVALGKSSPIINPPCKGCGAPVT